MVLWGTNSTNLPVRVLVRNLAGLGVESQVLSALAPTAAYDDSGRTVAERLAHLAQRREALLSLREQGVKALETMADSDLLSFFDRERRWAESALRWLAGRQAGQMQTTVLTLQWSR